MNKTNNNIGKRLDLFLLESLKENGYSNFSRSFLKDNWDNLISVNNSFPKPSYKIKSEDKIEINWEKIKEVERNTDRSEKIIGEQGDLDILYEDKDFLILDKSKGVVVHPGVGNLSNTLANKVRGYLEEQGEYDKNLKRVGLVHRLDKGVSGIMVFAKTPSMQDSLQKQFENHTVKKIYLAEVEYKSVNPDFERLIPNEKLDICSEIEDIENRKFVFDKSWYNVEGYIGRSSKNRIKMLFRRYSSNNGKKAISYIKPVSKNSLLISIETGRMHQIRATLEYLGLYIKGDTLYQKTKGKKIPEKIALKSVFLSFYDLNNEYFSICKI